jgi:hypothetical protein
VVDKLSSDVVGESLGFNVLFVQTIFGRFLGIRSSDHQITIPAGMAYYSIKRSTTGTEALV